MSLPEIEQTLLGYHFSWIEEDVNIEARHLKFSHDSLRGEIIVKTSLPGYNPHLHQANFNFSSTRSRNELTKALSTLCDTVDWTVIIEQLRVKTLNLFRQGEPVQIIDAKEKVSEPEYLLWPFIPKNQLSLIFGGGGDGKSTFALFLCLIAMYPSIAGEYAMKSESPKKVLYLDYETSKEIISWQWAMIAANFDCDGKIYYRRCDIPLTQDIEKLKECVYESQADLVIVDSAGIACGDNINEAHTANTLALALRSLNTTTLLISHTSKERSDRKTPFGSVYFFNNARNVWELKKTQEAGEDEITLGLFHRKSNISKLHKPFGFRFIYKDGSITVKKEDVTEIGEFEKELSLRHRIKNLLLQEGVMTIKKIAMQLSAGERVVRSRLNEMRTKGDVIKQGDQFAMHYK
jgi:hypothetical protein